MVGDIMHQIGPTTFMDGAGYTFDVRPDCVLVTSPAAMNWDLPFRSDFPCGWDERDAKV